MSESTKKSSFSLSLIKARHLFPPALIFSACCTGLFLSGCSDTTPSLTNVEATVVYVYDSPLEAAQQRLSVFVQSAVDTARIMKLQVFHAEQDIRWIIEKPLVISNDSRVYAGSANLMPPYFSSIPKGQYQVNYTDLTGKTASGNFFLDYQVMEKLSLDQPILTEKIEDTGTNEPTEPIKKIAVYAGENGTGTLLFLNKERREWETLADIQRDYSAAKSLRLCLDYPSRQVRYLLPPQNIESGE